LIELQGEEKTQELLENENSLYKKALEIAGKNVMK